MADLERSEKLMVALNAIERKADIIRMTAATPPQNQNTKRFAGEIMALVEQAYRGIKQQILVIHRNLTGGVDKSLKRTN